MQARTLIALIALCLLSTAAASAQIQGLQANYTSHQVAFNLPSTCTDMAVDRFNNVYIADRGLISDRIIRITSAGTIDYNFLTNIGAVGQLARNPADGLVYFTTYSPMLPVIYSTVSNIDQGGFVHQVGGVNVVAKGFTIDNAGKFYFGGMGLQGTGLYAGAAASTISATFLDIGHGQNSVLEALTNGDILIADGMQVRSWNSPAGPTVLYHQAPLIGNTMTQLNSLARNPFNPLGSGALVAQNTLTTFSMTGVGAAISGSLTGTSNTPFAYENYHTPRTGLRALEDGTLNDLYWLTDNGNLSPTLPPTPTPLGLTLHRIINQPAVGETGSHFVHTLGTPSGSGGALTFNVFGDPTGGDLLVLGVSIGTPPFVQTWYPSLGWFAIDPLGANYFAIADGLGAFGPADPTAAIPVGGHYTKFIPLSATVPSGIVFSSQALILAPNRAPNGLIVISNVVLGTTP